MWPKRRNESVVVHLEKEKSMSRTLSIRSRRTALVLALATTACTVTLGLGAPGTAQAIRRYEGHAGTPAPAAADPADCSGSAQMACYLPNWCTAAD
jgi:hypothetical protein